MLPHVRSILTLLALTLGISAVLYPLALLGLGRTPPLRETAEGSLVRDRDGKPVGSRLIAQPFKSDLYFQPRPSAADYNGAASAASNWGASNPLLRDRVAQALGPLVKYASGPQQGKPAGDDVVQWFRDQVKEDGKAPAEKRFLPAWANDHSAVAEQWVKNNAEAVGAWLGKDADAVKSESGDVVKTFFTDYAAKHPATWPGVEDQQEGDKTVKRIKPTTEGDDVKANLFDLWLQAHPEEAAHLERVPADLVMASGSGLDPHITLANARYQLDRVADAWAKKTGTDREQVRREIDKILEDRKESPLGGLAGGPLVNVLEVNLALEGRLHTPPAGGQITEGVRFAGCRAGAPEDSRSAPAFFNVHVVAGCHTPRPVLRGSCFPPSPWMGEGGGGGDDPARTSPPPPPSPIQGEGATTGANQS